MMRNGNGKSHLVRCQSFLARRVEECYGEEGSGQSGEYCHDVIIVCHGREIASIYSQVQPRLGTGGLISVLSSVKCCMTDL